MTEDGEHLLPHQLHNEGSLRADELANRHESGQLDTVVSETAVSSEVPQSTRIPVVDAGGNFSMATNVRPLEEVERIPGVNATEGDPPYVDPSSPTTEHDIEMAYKKASEGDAYRSLAHHSRDMASELAKTGDLERAEDTAKLARDFDNGAREDEEEAGDRFNIEHGLPLSKERVQEREKQLFDVMQMHADGIKEAISEITDLRKKYPKESTEAQSKMELGEQSATEPQADSSSQKPNADTVQSNEEFLAEQRRLYDTS